MPLQTAVHTNSRRFTRHQTSTDRDVRQHLEAFSYHVLSNYENWGRLSMPEMNDIEVPAPSNSGSGGSVATVGMLGEFVWVAASSSSSCASLTSPIHHRSALWQRPASVKRRNWHGRCCSKCHAGGCTVLTVCATSRSSTQPRQILGSGARQA